MNVEATLNVNNERVSLTLINKTKQKYKKNTKRVKLL